MTQTELLVLLIAVALVAALHLVLAWRLFGRGSGLWRWRWYGRGVLALSATLILVAFPGGNHLPHSGELLSFQYVGFFAMGIVLVLFPLTLARDVALAVRRGVRALRGREESVSAPESPALASRRQFLRALSSAGVLGSSSALAGAGAVQARQLAEVRRVRVPIENLHPDLVGLRIAQISDLHIGPILGRAWLDEVVTAVNTNNISTPAGAHSA